MSWFVTRNTGGGGEPVPYVVRRYAPYNDPEGVVREFTAQRLDDVAPNGGFELDYEVRERAHTFCDALNAGGVARERALTLAAGLDAGGARRRRRVREAEGAR